MNITSIVNKIHKAVKEELCGRKGLGWDFIDSELGTDGLEKEIDDALKSKIQAILLKELIK